MEHHPRLRRSVASCVLAAIILGLLASTAHPPIVAAQGSVLAPEQNAFFGFRGPSCPPAYPAFGLCRAGGIVESGLTTVLPGTRPFDASKLALNPNGSGTLSITSTPGDAYQNFGTNQDNALAVPFDASRRPFSVGTRLRSPFGVSQNFQSGGLVLGLDGNNYAKLVMGRNTFAGAAQRGIQFGVETNGTFLNFAGNPALPNVTTSLDLFLSADPAARTLTALYRVDSDAPEAIVEIGTLTLDPKFFAGTLYGGLLTTNNGTASTFTFTFDWLKVGEYVRPGSDISGVSFSSPERTIDRALIQALDPATAFANPTSLAFGPDGRLYAGTYSGRIYSFALDAAGRPSDVRLYEQIYNRPNRTCPSGSADPLVPPPGQICPLDPAVKGRQLLGIGFGPDSTPTNITLYATHSDPRFTTNNTDAAAKQIDIFSGTLSRLTIDGSGAVTANQDVLTGLPRSREYHSINGLDFDSDGWLYIGQGGNTNNGVPSSFFSYLPEYFLSAAILRVKPDALAAPLDLRMIDEASDLSAYSGSFELYATGLRNPYDLVWHSSGKLYANVNTSNSGLGTPPGPDQGCPNGAAVNIPTQNDDLEWVQRGKYYGHPSPVRGECIWENGAYPGGPTLAAEPSYVQPVYSYSGPRSLNGIAEYTADSFAGTMRGNLIVAASDGTRSVRRLVLSAGGGAVSADYVLTQAVPRPIDVAVAADGAILIADIGSHLSPGNGPGGIYILRPNDTTPSAPLCRSAGVDPAFFDSDSDGFLDQDELDNGTDICSAASKPIDSNGVRIGATPQPDGYLLSDLHDLDIDGDGLRNNAEQLQFDAANGTASPLPILFDFVGENQRIGNTGFSGVLLRGDAGATLAAGGGRGFGLYQTSQRLQANGVSGALGLLATPGSSRGVANDQDNFLQIGFDAATQPFSITTEIGGPFVGVAGEPASREEAGLYFGRDADTYVALRLTRTSASQAALTFSAESAGVVADALGQSATPTIALPFTGTVRLALVGSPAAGYLAARYSLVPPGLGEAPSPWQTIGVLHGANFADLSDYFVAPGCGGASAGCVSLAGLAATGPDLAYGFTEFRVDPFFNAPPGAAASGFTAQRPTPLSGPVGLTWQTSGQALLSGFHIYRGASPDRAAATKITASPIAIAGDPLERRAYSYSDTTPPVNPVYYWLEPQLVDGDVAAALTAALNSKANQAISFAALPDVTFGAAPISLAASASSGLAVSFSAEGACSVSGATLTISAAGSCAVTASQAGNATYNPAPAVPRSFAIGRAAATLSVDSAVRTYDGAAQPVAATTLPAGLDLAVTYTGSGATTYGPSSTPPSTAGEYSVSAAVTDPNYSGSADGTLVIAKAAANISVAGLVATFSGQPHAVTVTTTPAGLGYSVVYSGVGATVYGPSTAPPSAVGVYQAVVTIDAAEPNYSGAAEAELKIVSMAATVSVSSRSVAYDGTPQALGVITTPPNTPYSLTYSGVGATVYGPSATPPTNAGEYSALATVTDPNYSGSASGSLTIKPAQVELTIGGLSAGYDGQPKPVSVTTQPAGVPGVAVSYTGVDGTSYGPTAVAPREPGSYLVTVTLDNPNYSGGAVRTLTIARAAAQVSIVAAGAVYDGQPHGASVTTTPAGLPIVLSYAGVGGTSYGPSPAPPRDAGSYRVVASVNSPRYLGLASANLTIARAAQAISFPSLPDRKLGDPSFALAATATSGLPLSYSATGGCSVSAGRVSLTAAGTCTVTASQAGSANYLVAPTLSRSFKITQPVVVPEQRRLYLPLLSR